MIILHKIDEFIWNLFPNAKKFGNSSNILIEEITDYYSYGPYKPKVTVTDDLVQIEIDVPAIIAQEQDFEKAVKLCEKGKYDLAKPILLKLIKKNPSISEYHRVLGQVYSEEQKQEQAMDVLIDALKWDPRNKYALTMMGNIISKYKNDIPLAMKYYDQALAIGPDDYITLTNIGGSLLQLGRIEEGLRYFEISYEIKQNYPNTTMGLAKVAEMKGENEKAFSWVVATLKNTDTNNPLHKHSYNLIQSISKALLSEINDKAILEEYLLKIESKSTLPIQIITDETIPTAAKMEYAENYNRDVHLIKYKNKYPAVTHLIMHELGHYDLVLQARNSGKNINKLFTSSASNKAIFTKDFDSNMKRLESMGLTEGSLTGYRDSLFNGLNQQIFNCPIDLFIEDFLYNKFPRLRALQFLSLDGLIKEGILAVTDKSSNLIPKEILNVSKILNIVSALQIKELFGVNYIGIFNASASQINLAEEFYREFLEMKLSKAPGDEYKLVQNWANRLNVNSYFELIPEDEFKNRSNLEDVIKKIQDDPLSQNDPVPDDALKKPLSFTDPAGKMAVTMYCLDALQTFDGMAKEKIKEVAFEIGMLGTTGIDPFNKEKKYHLAFIPEKTFTGLHLLSFMYVAWQIVDPSLPTNLDFKSEYEMAKQMFSGK